MMSIETKVKTIRGDFRRASEFVKGTWQSSAEITKDRIANTSLRREHFYTNNHALYDIKGDDAFLYFGSKNDSIFRKETIDKAFDQLKSGETNHYYRPPKTDVAKAKKSSLKLRISDLELKFDNASDNCGYVEVDTFDLTGSNFKTGAQREFAEAVYGSMKQDAKGNSDYGMVMKMLNNKGKGIKIAKIYSFRKETVLKDAKDGAVARACWLGSFGDLSYFGADDGGVDYLSALRGVSSVGEADARKEMSPIQRVYTTLNNTPLKDLAAQMTPETATRMSNILATYLKIQQKQ